MAAFSRLQLAAALIEYDNDASDPTRPFYSAQESAIFSYVRNTQPPPVRRPSSGLLGVALPSDAGGGASRSSEAREREHARAPSALSMAPMTNPFAGAGADEAETEEAHEDELDVDLTSWGLDSFIPKDKAKEKERRKKGKMREGALPNPHDGESVERPHSRAASVDLNNLGNGGAFLDDPPPRRRSLSSAVELGPARPPSAIIPRERAHSLFLDSSSGQAEPPLHSVPFPTQSIRSPSPGPSLNPGQPTHGRSYSSASWNSRLMLEHALPATSEEAEPNPFALAPPSPTRTSRFDPKAARASVLPDGASGFMRPDDASAYAAYDDDARSAHPARARSRVMSTASMGSRMLDDAASARPLSTLELLRPKVLVMPSPLQNAPQLAGRPAAFGAPAGFEVRVGGAGTPLPAGARPTQQAGFAPNPRANMSLAQLVFRNQLLVDGARDVAYADIDGGLARATEDGQQVPMMDDGDEVPVRPVSVVVDEFARPAGKLYGKSLIDELEERKATARGKQRVFYGDDRPSMMARASSGRLSTLIDPATLRDPPTVVSQQDPQRPPVLARRSSYGAQPLVDLSASNNALAPPARPGMPGNSRSVFGTDTLWEKEMAKLREIEAAEAVERQAREAREAKEEAARVAKAARKKKGKGRAVEEIATPADAFAAPAEEPAEPRVSMAPPTLPAIPRNITRGPPPPPGASDDEDEDEDEDSDSDSARGGAPAPARATWFAGASDDEGERPPAAAAGPVRTTGVGLRYPRGHARGPSAPAGAGEDSEEDLPLAAVAPRAARRAADDSDEDRPLTQLLARKPTGGSNSKGGAPTLSMDFDNMALGASALQTGGADSDEDDVPLGLRVSHVPRPAGEDSEDEDAVPLGVRADANRRTQYAALVAQQAAAQQSQVAQMQQMQMQQMQMGMGMMTPMGMPMMAPMGMPAMGMGAPMMAPMGMPGMMGAPMMGMVPPPSGSPPPVHDSAKFNRVDQWRKNIAVDS